MNIFLSLACLSTIALAQPDDQAMLDRSLLSMGDTSRLCNVLAKIERGEKITVGVIGGSITQGASATEEKFRWGDRVAAWFRETYPNAQIDYVNAGIGATGSNIAAHRAPVHLLNHQPDLVICEFGVNDGDTRDSAETLEGLVRQILSQPNNPAVMLLFTMHRNGANAQSWQTRIGYHYGLPMASFRDACWPEIEAERMTWETIEADEVHPNNYGHELCARYVTNIIGKVREQMQAGEALPEPSKVPPTLISDVFQRATFLSADNAQPVVNKGWTTQQDWPFGQSWATKEAGSTIEFDVEATCISIAHFKVKGPMGRAEVQIDDLAPVVLEGWFDADWGGYSHFVNIARDLPFRKHHIKIRVLDDKAEASTGYEFRIQAIMLAGLQ